MQAYKQVHKGSGVRGNGGERRGKSERARVKGARRRGKWQGEGARGKRARRNGKGERGRAKGQGARPKGDEGGKRQIIFARASHCSLNSKNQPLSSHKIPLMF